MPRSGLFCFMCAILSVLALWFMSFTALTAQETPTTEGREFWLVFQKNFRDYVAHEDDDQIVLGEPLHLGLTITSRYGGKGYIESADGEYRQDFNLNAGEAMMVEIDPWFQLISSGLAEKKAVRVVADQPVSVYGTNHRYQSTDTYLALPVESLGTRYRVAGYKWLAEDLISQLAVVATEDNTVVEIIPNVATEEGRMAGEPYTIQLNRGETWQVRPRFNPANSSDLTGSLVQSSKPVAVFSGHNCAYVPSRQWKACNILVEQLPPTQTWGKEFVLGPLEGQNSTVYRVIADEDGTEVFQNGKSVAQLSAGEFYEEDNLLEPILLTASGPVMVMQYAKGFTAPPPAGMAADSTGDPMMILVPPTGQFLVSYRFMTPFEGEWQHYVNVVLKQDDASGLRLDGKPVTVGMFQPIPGSPYLFARVPVKDGPHSLEGTGPFGVYSYGFGFGAKRFDAYGNNCGQALADITEQKRPRRDDEIHFLHEENEYRGYKLSEFSGWRGTEEELDKVARLLPDTPAADPFVITAAWIIPAGAADRREPEGVEPDVEQGQPLLEFVRLAPGNRPGLDSRK